VIMKFGNERWKVLLLVDFSLCVVLVFHKLVVAGGLIIGVLLEALTRNSSQTNLFWNCGVVSNQNLWEVAEKGDEQQQIIT